MDIHELSAVIPGCLTEADPFHHEVSYLTPTVGITEMGKPGPFPSLCQGFPQVHGHLFDLCTI